VPLVLLDVHRDGLAGFDLGIVGECQYALSFRDNPAGDVFRRRASDVGTYGGWRWESSSSHPAQHPADPLMSALATRIAATFQAAMHDTHARVGPLGPSAQSQETAPPTVSLQ
jgi:hypothetical protein